MVRAIIKQAETTLLSPRTFYNSCQKQLKKKQKKLYFILLDQDHLESGIKIRPLCYFLDYLAKQIRQKSPQIYRRKFEIQAVCLYHNHKHIKALKNKAKQSAIKQNITYQITIETVGEGMIGRVAKLTINQQQSFAFKTFFYPHYVWNHGPWGEIPVGIYLKANQVTKDFAEFYFASQDWTIWEWIDPETKPQFRKGITYQEFAQKSNLTRLNSLNYRNYNPHLIRLDPGGVQQEYPGRYFWDLIYGLLFYLLKIKQEGLFSLLIYLNKANLMYFLKRVFSLIFSNLK
jgi:hypothetical protein